MKEVCEILNLSPEDIEQSKKKQKHPISESETLKVLNNILTVLIRIESALTKNNTIEHQ